MPTAMPEARRELHKGKDGRTDAHSSFWIRVLVFFAHDVAPKAFIWTAAVAVLSRRVFWRGFAQ